MAGLWDEGGAGAGAGQGRMGQEGDRAGPTLCIRPPHPRTPRPSFPVRRCAVRPQTPPSACAHSPPCRSQTPRRPSGHEAPHHTPLQEHAGGGGGKSPSSHGSCWILQCCHGSCWIMQCSHGSCWILQCCHGSCWILQYYHGSYWILQCCHGSSWILQCGLSAHLPPPHHTQHGHDS